MNETYQELYEKLLDKYADEKGVVRGEPVMMLYQISRYAESVGFDSIVDVLPDDLKKILITLNTFE